MNVVKTIHYALQVQDLNENFQDWVLNWESPRFVAYMQERRCNAQYDYYSALMAQPQIHRQAFKFKQIMITRKLSPENEIKAVYLLKKSQMTCSY